MSKLGIIVALCTEAKGLTKKKLLPSKLENIGSNTWLYISGIGAENAKRGLQALHQNHVTHVVNIGFAGALKNKYNSGDIIIADAISNGDKILSPPTVWRASIYQKLCNSQLLPKKLYSGTLLSSIQIIDQHQKNIYFEKADCVDMEAYSLVKLAQQLNIEFVAIKSILDEVETPLSNNILKYVDQYGEIQLKDLLLQLIRKPTECCVLLSLSSCYYHAMHSLKAVAPFLLDNSFILE